MSPYGVFVSLARSRVPTVVLVATINPTPINTRTIISDTATAAIVPLLLPSSLRGSADNSGLLLDLTAGGVLLTKSLLGFGGPSGWFNSQVYKKKNNQQK